MLFCRAHFEGISARAAYVRGMVFWMCIGFHNLPIITEFLRTCKICDILLSYAGMNIITANQESLGPVLPIDPEIEEMSKAGVHLGHAKSKSHPSMAPFLFGVRNSVSLIDLVKTKERMLVTLEFIQKTVANKGVILLVGTRPAAKAIIKDMGDRTGMPYFIERWIGGTLTNFKV